MAVNPLYAGLAAKASGEKHEDAEAFNPEVGDKVSGTILYVSDPFKKPNKFYRDAKIDSGTGEVIVKAKGEKEITTVKIVIQDKDGKKWNIYLQKNGHWTALTKGLIEAEQSDPPVGWKMLFKRLPDNDKAHVFEIKFRES